LHDLKWFSAKAPWPEVRVARAAKDLILGKK
jgi:hypothetical protein